MVRVKFIPTEGGGGVLELTRRNLQALLDKLDDHASVRTLAKVQEGGGGVILVRAVEDAEHYSDRPPGAVYMPSTGETR